MKLIFILIAAAATFASYEAISTKTAQLPRRRLVRRSDDDRNFHLVESVEISKDQPEKIPGDETPAPTAEGSEKKQKDKKDAKIKEEKKKSDKATKVNEEENEKSKGSESTESEDEEKKEKVPKVKEEKKEEKVPEVQEEKQKEDKVPEVQEEKKEEKVPEVQEDEKSKGSESTESEDEEKEEKVPEVQEEKKEEKVPEVQEESEKSKGSESTESEDEEIEEKEKAAPPELNTTEEKATEETRAEESPEVEVEPTQSCTMPGSFYCSLPKDDKIWQLFDNTDDPYLKRINAVAKTIGSHPYDLACTFERDNDDLLDATVFASFNLFFTGRKTEKVIKNLEFALRALESTTVVEETVVASGDSKNDASNGAGVKKRELPEKTEKSPEHSSSRTVESSEHSSHTVESSEHSSHTVQSSEHSYTTVHTSTNTTVTFVKKMKHSYSSTTMISGGSFSHCSKSVAHIKHRLVKFNLGKSERFEGYPMACDTQSQLLRQSTMFSSF